MKQRAALLLAGGVSRRMGRDKALLKWRGEPMWRRQVRLLREAAEDVPLHLMVGCREAQNLHRMSGSDDVEVEWLFDPVSEAETGPLAVVARALSRTSGGVLVIAVDMPNLDAELLRALWARAEQDPDRSWVVAEGSPAQVEPLCAVYSAGARRELMGYAAGGGRWPALRQIWTRWMAEGKAATWELDAASAGKLRNCNLPEDWPEDEASSEGET
ncbi:MAG: molybdenum cofactor guanylyltransferase [Verrucomicrobiales bacterium]|nr:molybdenum cofactor guanylyltransferase [Verrucomicrobiales bacterium]